MGPLVSLVKPFMGELNSLKLDHSNNVNYFPYALKQSSLLKELQNLLQNF